MEKAGIINTMAWVDTVIEISMVIMVDPAIYVGTIWLKVIQERGEGHNSMTEREKARREREERVRRKSEGQMQETKKRGGKEREREEKEKFGWEGKREVRKSGEEEKTERGSDSLKELLAKWIEERKKEWEAY